MKIAAVIMAAGKGTRMKSELPKVLHELAGRPLVTYALDTARSFDPEKIVLIVGHGRDLVMERLSGSGIEFAVQDPQLGTGHALMQTEPFLGDFTGAILVLSGDVPLTRPETIEKLLNTHAATSPAMTVLTCEMDDPWHYGRIIRQNGKIAGIAEAKDATEEQLKIREINAGIYVFDSEFLYTALKKLTNDNAQGEYYITDLISIAVNEGLAVEGVTITDHIEIEGVNTPQQLEALGKELEARIK